MSKFKKSLKRTGKNLAGSGIISICPLLGIGLAIAEDDGFAKMGNKHIGYTMGTIGAGLLFAPFVVVATGATLAVGSVCIITCTLAGAVDIAYGGCYDVIHYLSNNEQAIHLEEPVVEADSSHATVIKNLSGNGPKHKHKFSQYMQSYLENFQNKKPFSARLNELKLSQDERALFDNYLDPITQELIEIPVILNEQAYDYATILQILNTNSVDPIKNIPFVARDISPNRHMLQEIEKIVETLMANHQKGEQETAQHITIIEESQTQTLQLT